MKSVLFSMLVLLSSSLFAGDWDRYNWYEALGPDRGDWHAYTDGYATITAVPGTLVYDAWGRYIVRNSYVHYFAIRVGSGSNSRGCKLLQADSGARSFTGIHSAEPNLRPTKLVAIEASRSRPGWTNYIFAVNGGRGTSASHVSTVFQYLRSQTSCYYNVLFTSGESRLQRTARAVTP